MHRIRTTLLALVAIPALLGFQIVSDQLMLCDFGSREIIICEIDPQTSAWFCLVVPCEPEMMANCEIREELQLALSGCFDAQSSAVPCENQAGDPCDGTEIPIPDCPMGSVRRYACIPGRLLVLPADAAVSRLTLAKIYPSVSATLDLRLADLQRVDRHAHSPPHAPPVLASGYEICLEKCSLLL